MSTISVQLLINKVNKKMKRRNKRRGVTPIVATILILAMVTAGVVIGFVQVIPYLERSRVETGAASVEASLIRVDKAIWELISDSSGNFISGSYPNRRIEVNLPIGVLESIPTKNNIIIQPICTGLTCTTTYTDGIVSGTFGAFVQSFQSTYEIIPAGTLEYLTGADPLESRDIVAYNTISSTTSTELTATNMTLYRDNFYHYVELNYRPKILVSQSIENGNPIFEITIFLIDLNTAGTFIGTTGIQLQYLGATVNRTVFTGTQGDTFELQVQVGSTSGVYAQFDATTGGYTTTYRVSTVIQSFNLI